MFESTAWLIYVYIIIGNIIEGAIVFSVLIGFGIGIYAFYCLLEEDVANIISPLKKFMWLLIPTIVLGAFYPSTDEIKLILGGATIMGVGTAAVNIEGANELPQNLVDAANTFLEGISEKPTSE